MAKSNGQKRAVGTEDGVSLQLKRVKLDPDIGQKSHAKAKTESNGGVAIITPAETSASASSEDEDFAEEDENLTSENAEHNQDSKSRESHAAQKALAKERKAAKPNSDAVQRTKKIWERLRLKSHVPSAERKKLVEELFTIITGRVKDFVFKHDSVRVVQTALKYGNLEQRTKIAQELRGSYRKLAESRYAKFLISKLLVHGGTEIRDLIVPEFVGHVRSLMKHAEASQILDDIYRGFATPQQKALLLSEWYGPEFAIFQDEKSETSLEEILEATPEKRPTIMKSLFEMIKVLVEKHMHGFVMLHDAMLEYFLNAKDGSDETNEFSELLKSDEDGNLLRNMAYTKSGARVVSIALARGSAKDRKIILKCFKGHVRALSEDEFAHQIILAAFESVDDTVLLSKTVIAELLIEPAEMSQAPTLLERTQHLYTRVPLLYLHCGRAKWLLSNDTLSVMTEIENLRQTTSKKDPAVRRSELLVHIYPGLLQVIQDNARTLTESSFGTQFVTGILLEPSHQAEKEQALKAVATIASGDPTDDSHLSHLPAAGRMFKSLVVGGRFDAKEGRVTESAGLGFANVLYTAIQHHAVAWACGPSSFAILAMLESEEFLEDEKLALKKELNTHRKLLEQAAAPVLAPAGDSTQKSKKKQDKTEWPNNMGSSLILKLI